MTPRTPIWCHWRLFTSSGVAHAPGTAARPRSSYGRLRNVGTKRAVKAEGSGPSARRKPQRPSHRPGSGRPFVPRGPRRSFWLPGEGVERGGMGEGGGATAGRNCSETLCKSQVAPRVGPRQPSNPTIASPSLRDSFSFPFSSLGKRWDFRFHLRVTSGKS